MAGWRRRSRQPQECGGHTNVVHPRNERGINSGAATKRDVDRSRRPPPYPGLGRTRRTLSSILCRVGDYAVAGDNGIARSPRGARYLPPSLELMPRTALYLSLASQTMVPRSRQLIRSTSASSIHLAYALKAPRNSAAIGASSSSPPCSTTLRTLIYNPVPKCNAP